MEKSKNTSYLLKCINIHSLDKVIFFLGLGFPILFNKACGAVVSANKKSKSKPATTILWADDTKQAITNIGKTAQVRGKESMHSPSANRINKPIGLTVVWLAYVKLPTRLSIFKLSESDKKRLKKVQ